MSACDGLTVDFAFSPMPDRSTCSTHGSCRPGQSEQPQNGSRSKVIVYAWVNDENTLRSSGSKSDPYTVFLKMLERGNPPDTWDLTSQKTDRLFSGEFRIGKSEHPAAYTSAGLSYDTKFDLRSVLELPFNDAYFSVPPQAPHGLTPQLGTLHPSMVRIAATAFSAARL